MIDDRFLAKIEQSGDCWLWVGSTQPNGYGKIGWVERLAHRAAYVIFVGAIPDGLEIDHLCHNRACVNPDHLQAVTHAANMARSKRARQTHCKRGHPLAGGNLYPGDKYHRRCRACVSIRAKALRVAS